MATEIVSVSATKKPYFKEIELSKIRIDGGTQQRPTDPHTVEEYAQMVRDGSPTPPGRLVFDGKDYWLWEGFHRILANEAAGVKVGNFYITRGTQRDAVWLSFSANRDHGLRRQRGVVREIVERIWKDETWGKVPVSVIAEHVGVTQRRVEQLFADIRAGKKPDDAPAGEPILRNASEDAPRTQSQTRTVTRAGRTYEMNTSGMKKPAASRNGDSNGESTNGEADGPTNPKVCEDDLGHVLTDPQMIEVFNRTGELTELLRTISMLRTTVAATEKDALYTFLPRSTWKADIDSAYSDLKTAVPYALCPVHPDDKLARKNCQWCGGHGWVTKHTHKLATDAMAAGRAEKK